MRSVRVGGLLLVLGCGGGLDWFPNQEWQDVDRETIQSAGYTVPEGASHIFVRDQGSQDERVTWMRYTLPPTQYAAVEREVATAAGVVEGAPPVASDFPRTPTPTWWTPTGRGYRRTREDGGTWWGFADPGTVQVCVWDGPAP